jgi:hypothetical protein
MRPDRQLLAGVALVALAGAARAEITAGDIAACLARHGAADPGQCVTEAHGPCLAFPAEAPSAAASCFLQAKAEWGALIADRMARLGEDVAEVARIEVTYDLLANLLQCDRLEELARLSAPDTELLRRQRAQCEATASGLTYLRLLRRAGAE